MSDEITIHVTAEDIENGQRMSAHECAIALAGKRELIDCDVEVSYSWISVDEGNEEFTIYTLPEEARVFVSDFDGGIPVEPFKFTARKMETQSLASNPNPWPIS